MMGIMFGAMIIGSGVIGLGIFFSLYFKQALIINLLIFLILIMILSLSQIMLKMKFWDKLDIIKA